MGRGGGGYNNNIHVLSSSFLTILFRLVTVRCWQQLRVQFLTSRDQYLQNLLADAAVSSRDSDGLFEVSYPEMLSCSLMVFALCVVFFQVSGMQPGTYFRNHYSGSLIPFHTFFRF